MKKRTYLWTIGITLVVGALSSFLTRNDMSYYTELVNKPMLTPPASDLPGGVDDLIRAHGHRTGACARV